MKKLVIALFVLSVASCGNNEHKNQAQQDDKKKDMLSTDLVNNPHSAEGMDTTRANELPTMDFADTTHNFGNLTDGEKANYDFEFTNNGKSPLIITSANGSCGCTVPDYPRKPLQPGESGKISVQFDSYGKTGQHVEKSVTISTNTKRGTHMLYIKADVK